MASSDSNISTVENEESGELFADLPTKSKRSGGIAPPPSAPRSQVTAAASLVGAASQARPSMPSSSGVLSTSPVPPPPPSRIPAPPTSRVPAPPSGRVSAPPPPPSKAAPVMAQVEYVEDNGDDATPVRAPVDGTPTVKLPDVAIVRAMTSAAAPPPSARPSAHVPPPASMRAGDSSMVPPPSVQAQAVTEIPQVASVPRGMLHSAPPTSMSQPPPPPQPAKSGASKFLVAAAAVLVLAVGGLAAKQAGVAGFGAKDGTLLASVAGPGGASIDKFELFVDGSKRCEASPCKVDGLTEGEHFLKVIAPGYESSAALSIKVTGGSTTDQRVDLVPSKDGAKAAEADSPAEKAKGEEALSLEDLGKKKPAEEAKDEAKPSAGSSATAAKAPSSSKSAAKDDKAASEKEAAKDSSAASDKGMINISSIPPVNVVVDGKPIGMSPKTVRVSAGSHTIVFIGAEGRQVRSVNVKGGGSTSVAVKF